MKQKQSLSYPLVLIVLGLVMVLIASMKSEKLNLPDFYKGLLIGLAIAMEVIAIIKLLKIQQSNQ